jgi:aspartyl-tRNA(Asn)/glutamyl-tRNA(Gln) amidotransferase subunit C
MRRVTIEDVRRVTELANLELTTEEEPCMQSDLNSVLGKISQLNEFSASEVAIAAANTVLGN